MPKGLDNQSFSIVNGKNLIDLILVFRANKSYSYSINRSASRYYLYTTIEKSFAGCKKLIGPIVAFEASKYHFYSINGSIRKFYPGTIIESH